MCVVTEPEAVESGWIAELHHHLAQAGLEPVTWDAVSPAPRDHEVVAALHVYRARDCDVIIGMGGRAAVDTAKAVAVLSSNGGSVADYDGFDRVTRPTPPTVMIPTTIGSGAEILQSTTAALSGLLAAFLGLHRGAVRAVLLPHAIRSQISPCVERYVAVARAVGLDTAGASGEWSAHAVADWMRALGDKVGIPAGLSELGVGVDTADRIALGAMRGIDWRSDHATASFEYASNLLRAAL